MAKLERVGTADELLEACTERRRGRGFVGDGGMCVARETRGGRLAFPLALVEGGRVSGGAGGAN